MDLSPAQKALLRDLLVHGDNPLSNIADNTDYERSSYYRVKDELEAEGLILDKGRGTFTLTNHGRREAARLVREESES